MLIKLRNYSNGLAIYLNARMIMDVYEDREVDATRITMENGDTYQVKDRVADVVAEVNKR